MKKRWLSILLVLALLCAVLPVPAQAAGFVDVPADAWYQQAVAFTSARGLVNGVDATHFNPTGTTTRAMFVTLLWRLSGSPGVAYEAAFADVPRGSWYAGAVDWAVSSGVTTGVDAAHFNPNGYVTREQAAAFLRRYTGADNRSTAALARFPDREQASNYAKTDLAWAIDHGYIAGVSTRGTLTLAPKGTATRAQVAQILMRLAKGLDAGAFDGSTNVRVFGAGGKVFATQVDGLYEVTRGVEIRLNGAGFPADAVLCGNDERVYAMSVGGTAYAVDVATSQVTALFTLGEEMPNTRLVGVAGNRLFFLHTVDLRGRGTLCSVDLQGQDLQVLTQNVSAKMQDGLILAKAGGRELHIGSGEEEMVFQPYTLSLYTGEGMVLFENVEAWDGTIVGGQAYFAPVESGFGQIQTDQDGFTWLQPFRQRVLRCDATGAQSVAFETEVPQCLSYGLTFDGDLCLMQVRDYINGLHILLDYYDLRSGTAYDLWNWPAWSSVLNLQGGGPYNTAPGRVYLGADGQLWMGRSDGIVYCRPGDDLTQLTPCASVPEAFLSELWRYEPPAGLPPWEDSSMMLRLVYDGWVYCEHPAGSIGAVQLRG